MLNLAFGKSAKIHATKSPQDDKARYREAISWVVKRGARAHSEPM